MIYIITYWVAVTLVCTPLVAVFGFIICSILNKEVSRITQGRVKVLEDFFGKVWDWRVPFFGVVIMLIVFIVAASQIIVMNGDRHLIELSIPEVIHIWALWLQPHMWWVILIMLYIFSSKYLIRLFSFLFNMKEKLDKL